MLQSNGSQASEPPPRVAVIGEGCYARSGIACRLCAVGCPAGAINFREVMGWPSVPEVDVAYCRGCDLCLRACPVRAIQLQDLG